MGRDSSDGRALLVLALIVLGAIAYRGLSSNPNFCDTNSDNVQLKELASLSADPSSPTNKDLLNNSYWDAVYSSAKDTVGGLFRSTYLGLVNSSQGWQNWSLQHFPNATSWVGFRVESSIHDQMVRLQSNATRTDNAADARATVRSYLASISGYSFAGLDFFSFNGLTSLKTFFETGSAPLALCVTFPGQLAQLYHLAFDSSVPQKKRAQYLGQAIAITSVMVVLSGHDKIADNLKIALDKVGLLDAWPAIKPYIAKLGTTVSTKATSLTFSVLQKIVQRFPQNSPWYAGLTIDRIEAMSEVLKEKGFTDQAIEGEISKLVNMADGSANPDDVPFAADVSSYNDGGGIRVKLNSENQIYLYSDTHGTQNIKVSFLEKEVAGFVKERPGPLKVRILEKDATLYLRYEAGETWGPTVSGDVAGTHDVLTITINVLTRDDFIGNLREISLGNTVGARWVSDITKLRGFSVRGNDLRIDAAQYPPVEGVSGFKLSGPVSDSFGSYNQWTTLDFQIKDLFGNTRGMRIYHDGYHSPWLGILGGDHYRSVYTLSYDGARLRVVYTNSREFNIATLYMSDPSVFYDLGEEGPPPVSPLPAVNKIYEIKSVDFLLPIDKDMIFEGTAYYHGRVGAEIAYTVGKNRYGLQDLVIREPSMGGADLITQDRTDVMQARFIQDFSQFKGLSWEEALQSQLGKLVSKLGQDFENNHSLVRGYAVLSYVDPNQPNVIKTIVAEVSAPVMRP